MGGYTHVSFAFFFLSSLFNTMFGILCDDSDWEYFGNISHTETLAVDVSYLCTMFYFECLINDYIGLQYFNKQVK